MKPFNCVQKNDLLKINLPTNYLLKNHMYACGGCKQGLLLNNPQVLICHKIQPNQIIEVLLLFLSLRFFGLLSSSLLLFPQRFGRYVLRPSSGVYPTREPSRNFERRPLLKPRRSPVLIPLAITGYKC